MVWCPRRRCSGERGVHQTGIKPRMVQTICLALMGPRGRLLCQLWDHPAWLSGRRRPVACGWRSAMEGNAWEHGRRGEAVEPLSDRRRMPRASVRATGLPVAPIRLRRRQRTDGPRTPTDLREDPRTRNDVHDADESLASWTRHRIGVRQRHRRRISGAPARFACPFWNPQSNMPIRK